jgi:hypothetical protein
MPVIDLLVCSARFITFCIYYSSCLTGFSINHRRSRAWHADPVGYSYVFGTVCVLLYSRLSHCYLFCVFCSLLCSNYSFYVCFPVLYVFCFLYCVFSVFFCIVLCIVSHFVYSYVFSTCVQVYGQLPLGGNAAAVNKYHIIRSPVAI